jgi:hypothetical protein
LRKTNDKTNATSWRGYHGLEEEEEEGGEGERGEEEEGESVVDECAVECDSLHGGAMSEDFFVLSSEKSGKREREKEKRVQSSFGQSVMNISK